MALGKHLKERLGGVRARLGRAIAGVPPPSPPPVLPPAVPEEVLAVMRDLGLAMGRAGDASDRITLILDDVARSFRVEGAQFYVLPTGVFVRIAIGESTRVDFAPGSTDALRLDQIDALYRIIDDIRHRGIGVDEVRRRLDALEESRPRFSRPLTLTAGMVMTLGLGLMMNPAVAALPAYLVLGLVVALLTWWAQRDPVLGPILPVFGAFAVAFVAFRFGGPVLGVPPLDLVIPALVTFLPGAALTTATVELSGGSMVSGAARLVYGLERLLLLTFGIGVGAQLAGIATAAGSSESLGAWAPWLGVLVFALGQYVVSSSPPHTLWWRVVVLYAAYGVQTGGTALLGSLGGSFLAGAVVFPLAYWVQARPNGPPAMVTFLPAFWLLVPGALGLQGFTEIVGADQAAGLGKFLDALLSVVAIAVGVLVGSGWAERIGRSTGSWRGV